jgi:cytochrome b561
MRHGGVAILLHWAVALGVAIQFTLGWWMVSLPDAGGVQAYWFNLHKSCGLTLGLLLLCWLAWRSRRTRPAYAAHMPRWQQRLAHATHLALLALLLLLVASGYAGSSFSGYPVRYFGWTLPAWGWKWPEAKALAGSLHLAATWLLAAATLLHVCGALWHAAQRDGVMRRMWPSWRAG